MTPITSTLKMSTEPSDSPRTTDPPETGLQDSIKPVAGPFWMPLIKRVDWRITASVLVVSISVPVWRANTSHAKIGPISRATHSPVVAVARVTRDDLFNEVTIPAEFRPYAEADLHAKVSGYVQH